LPANTGVMGLSVSGADNRVVLAATSYGMYRTTDAGGTWTAVGGGLMSGVQGVAFSPADPANAWTVGRSDSIRVFVSTDTGRTWTSPVPGYVTNKTAYLVPDPGDGATAWVSAMTGVFRSTDLGANWHEAHAGLCIGRVPCISASPEDPRRLYLEADDNGVFRSETGGDSWARCSDFLECGNICAIGVASATDRDVLYALEGSG
ncbi:hypothetical protein JXB37_01335, partial [candidate division WOR-3 bacterium]|nr:hypothetical protein [candidate division WOR-3 bacterium]